VLIFLTGWPPIEIYFAESNQIRHCHRSLAYPSQPTGSFLYQSFDGGTESRKTIISLAVHCEGWSVWRISVPFRPSRNNKKDSVFGVLSDRNDD
jgi:hypothetical protein